MLNKSMPRADRGSLTMRWVKVQDAQGRARMEMRWTAVGTATDHRTAA